MFDQLGNRLRSTVKQLRGQARLTETNIRETLREVRIALLEADVALPVVKELIDHVRQEALGAKVVGSLSPGQALVKIVHEKLVDLMGGANDALDLSARPPAVVLVAGLQGAGKTTTVAKLARRLHQAEKKRLMVVSADVYRPAAIDQLVKLAKDVEVEFFPSSIDQTPVEIVTAAMEAARNAVIDVLIVDSAGRMHVDDDMMREIQDIHAASNPIETLFVVDSMTGQDAVNSAAAFHKALPLTGIVLTKTDGDARGGAALSVRRIIGKPIKFIGTGEAMDALEAFHPDRVVSRILGMGDVLSLVEQVEQQVDREKAEKVAKKIAKGKGFDLEDFRDQMLQVQQMGGMASLMDKLPGMGELPAGARSAVDDKQAIQTVAIVNSMTPQERRFPANIRGSRKKRIAAGSGTQVQDVNRLLKQFAQMQKMMKKMRKSGGMAKMMRGMQGKMPGFPQ